MALGWTALPAHVHLDVMVVIGIAHEPQSLSSSCDSERLTFGRSVSRDSNKGCVTSVCLYDE